MGFERGKVCKCTGGFERRWPIGLHKVVLTHRCFHGKEQVYTEKKIDTQKVCPTAACVCHSAAFWQGRARQCWSNTIHPGGPLVCDLEPSRLFCGQICAQRCPCAARFPGIPGHSSTNAGAHQRYGKQASPVSAIPRPPPTARVVKRRPGGLSPLVPPSRAVVPPGLCPPDAPTQCLPSSQHLAGGGGGATPWFWTPTTPATVGRRWKLGRVLAGPPGRAVPWWGGGGSGTSKQLQLLGQTRPLNLLPSHVLRVVILVLVYNWAPIGSLGWYL